MYTETGQYRITPDLQRRFLLLSEIGCIPCILEGELRGENRRATPPDVNHILNGYRMGHEYTVPECPWHHRGLTKTILDRTRDQERERRLTVTEMEHVFGPSRKFHKMAFNERYGPDDHLLLRTAREIGKLEAATV